MDEPGIKLFDLRPSNEEIFYGRIDPIGVRVARSRIASQIRSGAKLKRCFYCNSEVEGMCNSHSIPKFTIKSIAKDGKVIGYQQILETPATDDDVGVNAACTFQIICRKCDSTIFQEYESPETYESELNNDIFVQIAMKNHLLEISRKLVDVQIYSPSSHLIDDESNLRQELYNVADSDINDHVKCFDSAKSIVVGTGTDKYRVGFFSKLDYVVPVAAQCCFALICGLDEEIINNPYDFHPNNQIQFLHLAIFPLEKNSVVIMFSKEKDTRYRRFFRKLASLSQNEQLSVIIYMLFLYSDTFVLSKGLPDHILKDENMKKAFAKSTITEMTDPECDSLKLALKEFSLSAHSSVPNLLHRDYAITKDQQKMQ